MNNTTPVVVLHGLGERARTLSLFIWFLQWIGFNTVVTPHWPANTCELDVCLDALDASLQQHIKKKTPIFVIGNSMGGVMAMHLHTRGWTIKKAIAVAAPLNGAGIFRWLESIAPTSLFDIFYQPGHAYLRRTEKLPAPPHPYHTLSFGPGFDGNVFEADTVVDNKQHTKFLVGTHFSLAVDPRVWMWIKEQICFS